MFRRQRSNRPQRLNPELAKWLIFRRPGTLRRSGHTFRARRCALCFQLLRPGAIFPAPFLCAVFHPFPQNTTLASRLGLAPLQSWPLAAPKSCPVSPRGPARVGGCRGVGLSLCVMLGGSAPPLPPACGTSMSTHTAAGVCPWFLGHGKWSEQGRAWLLSQPRAPPPLATSPAPPRSHQDLDFPLGLRGQGAVVVVLPTLRRVKSLRVPRSRARARRKRARGKAKRATATVARLRAWETGGDREIY